MTKENQMFDFAAYSESMAKAWRFALGNQGTEAVLRAEMEFLANAETAATEWLKRRREAVEATERLVTRLRDARDVTEVFTAQEEWMTAAVHRIFEDAGSIGKAASVLVNRTTDTIQSTTIQSTGQVAPVSGPPVADTLVTDPGKGTRVVANVK